MDGPFFGTYVGTVTENNDPIKRGRLRARVPGIHEPESPWVLPAGQPGGGKLGRGSHSIPAIGSQVLIRYLNGEAEHSIWEAGPWPTRAAEDGEPGGATTDVADGDDPSKVHAVETEFWRIAIDENVDTLRIVHKPSGNEILWEGGDRKRIAAHIETIFSLEVDGWLDLRATRITLNDRLVQATADPI